MNIPGITLCVGEEASRHFNSNQVHSQLHEEKKSGTKWAVSVCHHQVFYNKALLEDHNSGVGIAVDGYILPTSGLVREEFLSTCLQWYLVEGIDFIKKLNGAFNIVLWDLKANTVYLATDRYGLRPLSHGSFKGNDYVAVRASDILALSLRESKLNTQAFYNLLTYSRVWAGSDTLFKGIRAIPPASILTWQDGLLKERIYWDYRFEPVEEVTDDFVDHAAEVFHLAVKRHAEGFKRIGLNLSGGLDSRAVAAALHSGDQQHTTAFTWGYGSYCSEVQLAKQTADACEIDWRFIKLSPENFIENTRQGIRITEGRDLAVHGFFIKLFKEIRAHCDVSATGLGFDLLAGGSHCSEILDSAALKTGNPLTIFLKGFFYFKTFAEEMFQDSSQAASCIAAIEDQLRADLACDGIENDADLGDRFALRQRCWRVIFPRQHWQRLHVEDLTPTFDNDLVDILLRVPAHERAGHQFFRRLLQRLNPSCMEIPYQRTMLPPTVPTKFWGEGTRLEVEREALFRRIYHDTQGQVYIPYHRYYSNFDEWLRVNPSWKALVQDLLLSRDCRLTAEFIRPQWLRQMLDDQRSGKRAYYRQVIMLLTAELILRELF